MKRYKPLFENTSTQRDLELLADLIIDESVRKSIDKYSSIISNYKKYLSKSDYTPTTEDFYSNFHYLIYPIMLNDLKFTKLKIPKAIQPFITKYIGILFYPSFPNRGYAGTYRVREEKIIIILTPRMEEKIQDVLFDNLMMGKNIKEKKLTQILKEIKGTLIHELQHFLDDKRSDGKALAGAIDSHKDKDGYLTSQHEVNARYSNVVYIIKNTNEMTQRFSRVQMKFESLFEGWHLLDFSEQQRLIKRLYAEWREFNYEKI